MCSFLKQNDFSNTYQLAKAFRKCIGLQKLNVGWNFNQPFVERVLPADLQYLEFGWNFNHPFEIRVLPSSLKQLIVKQLSVKQLIDRRNFNHISHPIEPTIPKWVLPDKCVLSYFYTRSINVLRIMNGIGGLVFSS